MQYFPGKLKKKVLELRGFDLINHSTFNIAHFSKIAVTYTATESTPEYFTRRAQDADVCVVVVQTSSGEGGDRKSLNFPAAENKMVEIVANANPNTIVVVTTPGPSLMPWIDKVKGVLVVFLPGVAFGDALAVRE